MHCSNPESEIEAIERATVAAVAPSALDELPGWLLPFEAGNVGRAKSAVPLRHDASTLLAALPELRVRYAARGFELRLRLADVPELAQLRAAAEALGLKPAQPTLMQLTAATALGRRFEAERVTLSDRADPAFEACFSDGAAHSPARAHRLALLRRNPQTFYASVREAARVHAVGAVSFGFGQACVHGMRTQPQQRGRGLASRILSALARAALERGIERVLLQVETENAAALSLYQTAGFASAWQYRYWQ